MNTKTKQGGLGIVSILTIVFIVLKLSGVIKWHWIWVLSPIWISALTAVILFAGILIGGRLKRASGKLNLNEDIKLVPAGRHSLCLPALSAEKRNGRRLSMARSVHLDH